MMSSMGMVKKYQNVSFKELMEFSKKNPNRHRVLDPIEIQILENHPDPSLDRLSLKGYTAFHLNPTGILGLLICIQNPQYYSLSQSHVRMQHIIDLATELQQNTDKLKNTSLARKRKRIYDLIGGAYNGAPFQDKDYFDLFQGVSYLQHIQFILMKEAVQEKTETDEKKDDGWKGDIYFSSDPLNWKKEYPVWIADYRGRWLAVPTDSSSQPLHLILSEWIVMMEQNGWIIQWPEVDLTKTELIEYLSTLSNWQESDKKLSKDTLSLRYGKFNTLKLFTKWTSPLAEQSFLSE
jgi:hypothetical protein